MIVGLGLSVCGGQRTLIQRAIAILRRFGTNAHVYLPGVGRLNGLTAGNYIDSAGTTPGAVDQPVGLVLSAAGALGPELAVNGDFGNGLTGWSAAVVSGFVGGATLSVVNKVFRVTNDATGSNYGVGSQSFATVIGKAYEITLSKIATSVGSSVYHIGTGNNGNSVTSLLANISATRAVFVATASTTWLNLGAVSTIANAWAEWDNISMREVTGIHASQTTADNRPILKRAGLGPYSWQFDGVNDSFSTSTGGGSTSDFFYCGAVTPTGGANTNRTLWGDAGANTGYRVRINAANQLELAAAKAPTYSATLITNSDFATDTVWTKGAGWTIAAGMATGAASNASITQAAALTAGRSYEITYTVVTPTAGTVQMQLQGGTVVSGTARAAAGTYTETITAAAGNTTLGFLGANWSGSIDDVIIREIIFYVLATSAATVDVGVSNVLTAWDNGTNLNVQINNGAVSSVARPVVIAGSAGFSIGKDNGAASSFFTGNIYPLISIKGTLPLSDLTLIKKFVGFMSGVAI